MSRIVIIWWAVPCPSCGAAALQPCQDEGSEPDLEDVHLARASLFTSAKQEYPQWGLQTLRRLVNGEDQPENP